MAVKTLTLADITAYNTDVDVTTEAATVAADGFEVTADGDIMLFIRNTGATTRNLVIKAGTGMQGVADVTIASIAASATRIVKLSGGSFKAISGTYKGKYRFVPDHIELQVKAFKY